jgi:hypothetical protein
MLWRREYEREDCSKVLIVCGLDSAAVFLNDTVCNGETEAGAVAHALRRKERIEYLA